ncbi:MAG: T9SS type A sorting domain-containing protein [Chlorobi bacterium]|nr:T9SS type A sorting domain-containing protein [Chlorobiota bacterium]
MKRNLLVFFLSGFISTALLAQTSLFISEVADPADHYQGRFVELYNSGATPIDLGAGNFYLVKQVNGGTYYDIQLTGTINPGSTFVIANNNTDFQTYYGFAPDMSNTSVSGNGDDGYYLYMGGDHTTGTLLDAYGEPDIDGTGTAWEYLDGKAVRNSDIGLPNTTWTASEWTITQPANVADMTPGSHTYIVSGPPVWNSGYPLATFVRDDKATVVVNMDRAGKAYVIVVLDGSANPTSSEVKAGQDYGAVTVLDYDSVEVTNANMDFSVVVTCANPATAYDIWVVAQDDATVPNVQTDPVKLDITTTALRNLSITNPAASDVFNLGDTIVIRWAAANIDSLYLASYDYTEDSTSYILEDNDIPQAIPVSPDSFELRIPHDAGAGDYDLILMDAADTTFQTKVGPITVQDNRVLTWIAPVNNSTFYVGDTVVFKWNTSGIDSILIGGVDYQDTSIFWLTVDEAGNLLAVPATPDSLVFPIPLNASTDSVRLIIYDAEDTSFYNVADPVYLIDTIKPEIYMLVPENGKDDVPLTFSPLLFFNEKVNATSGNLYLYKDDGTLIETFDLTAAEHDWGVFMFQMSSVLEPATHYYFKLDQGVIADMQGNIFNGLNDSTTWQFTTASAQPYFSEYVEGSSNNKALEIYNPTDHVIDLSGYALVSTFNGGGFDWTPYPLSGLLDPGDVYVIINPDFDFSLLADSAAVVDTIWGNPATWFNGDDARGLAQLVGGTWDDMTDYSIIDVIGIDTEDPGSGWDVAGVSAATANHTLLRKPTVKMGNLAEGWSVSAGTDPASSEWKVFDQNFVANLGLPTPTASDRTDISGFKLYDTTGVLVSKTVTIDSAAATIDVEILFGYGTVMDSLVPALTLAPGATSVPVSGDTVDFTNPVVFTVTAEDQITTRDWTVTVTEAASASTETDITSFVLAEATGPAVIDTTAHTVTAEVAFGTDLTVLVPTIEISAGATVNPASGAVTDFTNPVTYTVTAQDGTTTQDWTVTVTAFEPPTVTIHDIQYTTDPSGDSPYKGQMVRTSGIVTAINIYQSAFKGYFLQDAAAAWNGIYVYDPDHDTTQIGDSVTIVATVDEYYNLTELKSVAGYTTVSTGNTLPGPVSLTTGEASTEQWESVFVTFNDATCTANDLGYDEVSVDDGSGALIVDDFLYDYDATADFAVNNIYDLTGVMNYSYGDYKLNPRSADDISDVTGINTSVLTDQVLIYPNPNNGRFTLTVKGMQGNIQVTVINTLGKVMLNREFSVSGEIREDIDMTNQPDGLYFIRVRNGNNTTVRRIVIR